jgi:cobalt transporter subunit CbtA
MIVRFLLAALAAGMLAGILMTPVQSMRVTPLILHAEEFEVQAPDHHTSDPEPADAAAQNAAAEHTAAETEGAPPTLLFGRSVNTLLANLVTGAGFALLLAGVSLVSGIPVTFAAGLAWGAAGWLAVQFLPSLGLPPELPGFPYVDLKARQYWWIGTVAASVFGMALLFLRKENFARFAGVALILAPHLVGAPQPADITSKVPAFLAAEFVMAALSTTLFFWLALGLLMGFFMDRSGKSA